MDATALVTLILAAAAALAATFSAVVTWSRRGSRAAVDALRDQVFEQARETRREIAEQARGQRSELGGQLEQFGKLLVAQQAELRSGVEGRLQTFASELHARAEQQVGSQRQYLEDARKARAEQGEVLARFGEAQRQALVTLVEQQQQQAQRLRETLEAALRTLREENTAKLEQMRRTVDEKLNETLERRLGESFKQVGDRLEQVHKGLGEMQALATGVGDLKRVLTNVKTRGTWAELELDTLLADLLTPEQYDRQVAVRQGSGERVDFAVRLPGHAEGVAPVWLPIDSKFPREDYERLQDAQEHADAERIRSCGADLEKAIRLQARSIGEKYIAPPATTDFAILFLPTEGLFAEVVRRPGLVDSLQRDSRVVVAGPTTLAMLLKSLQMGFRTLAIEQRSSEVWQVLGAVKTEFDRFGVVLAKVKKKLREVSNTIDDSEVRKRAVDRRLRDVQALPTEESAQILALPERDAVDEVSEEDSGHAVT